MKCILCFLFLMVACTPANVPQLDIDCQISCEYMKHLTGRDGQMGCEETRELILSDGEVITCLQQCRSKQVADHKCFVKAQICNQIETVCE